METKYHFVKIRRKGGSEKGTWYFHPQTEEQLIEHFKKVMGAEIKAGMDDWVKSSHKIADSSKPEGYWMYHAHPVTPWSRVVTSMLELEGGTFLEMSLKLENEVINNRLHNFRCGKDLYLDNGVVETRMLDDDEVVGECYKDELVYPVEAQIHLEDVRYMQWNMPDLNIKGTHWYAKIGNTDIVDKDGNMKWNTKAEAEKAAEWFIYTKLQFKRYNE